MTYARVSSIAQRERDTIASQLRVLPAFIASRSWELVRPIETYVDDGFSAKAGRLEARTGLAALLRDAALGLFDVVVVVDLDRLTRSENLGERGLILGALQDAGVRVAAAMTGEVLDLRTDHGDLMASLKSYLAAAENRKRGERVRQGKLSAAQRGRKASLGPYGFLYDAAAATWSHDPTASELVREIFERVAAGEGCWAIAVDFQRRGLPYRGPSGRWSRGRVYDVVRSRAAAGEWLAHKATRTVVAVPPIVDGVLWQRAQDALVAGRKARLRKTKHVYVLEGLARCGSCGGRMFVQSGCWAKGRFWRPAIYICEHRKNRRVGPDRCDAAKVPVDAADARVWAAICGELADPELPGELAADRRAVAADAHDWERDAAGYRAHLDRLEKVAGAVLVRFRRGAITEAELDQELAGVNRERAAVRAQLATAERVRGATISAQARLREATAAMERVLAKLAAATTAERRDIARTLIDPGGVVFHGTSMRVELFVERPAATERSGVLATAELCSGGDESRLRIRVVA